jgi:hypothetical protein
MRKLVSVLAILVLVGAAFAGGYYLHLCQSMGHVVAIGEVPSLVSTEPRPAKPPEWTAWQYPGSTEGGSSKGGGGTLNRVRVGPIYSVILTTPDDLDKVLEWYANKFDSEIIAVPTGSGSMSRVNTANQDDPVINGNVMLASDRPSDDRAQGRWRPVRMKVISVRTPRYDLVLNVSRADGESHTHVVVTYFPNQPGE